MRAVGRGKNGLGPWLRQKDLVMRLAIANRRLKYVGLPEYREEKPLPKSSLGWFERFVLDEGSAFERVPIGAHNFRKRM